MKSCENCIHIEVCAYVSHQLPACEDYAEAPVRCKDCNHVFICNCLSCRQGVSVYCGKYGKHMKTNDFCSYGERRTDDEAY